MKHYTVAIIGSGPSGAATALYLAQNGISTVIIEKETLPRYKTCGGGFVYRGRKDLPIDIKNVVEKEFFNVDIYCGKHLHFETKRDTPTISMIMRDSFDRLIVKKSEEFGADLLENHKLTSLIQKNGLIHLETSQGSLTANFVIAADGAIGQTAKMAGWDKDTRTLIPALEYEIEVSKENFDLLSNNVRFDMDVIPYGYAWCFPKKKHLSIGVTTTQKSKINLKKLCEEYMMNLGINHIIKISKHGFQIPISPRKDGFVKNGVFLIGDAAGFADPITAEGISNAIYSGKLVAKAIIQSNLDKEKAEKLYIQKLEKTLLPELKTALWISKQFYQKKNLRNLILKKYGQKFSDTMAAIFHGERKYPSNYKTIFKL